MRASFRRADFPPVGAQLPVTLSAAALPLRNPQTKQSQRNRLGGFSVPSFGSHRSTLGLCTSLCLPEPSSFSFFFFFPFLFSSCLAAAPKSRLLTDTDIDLLVELLLGQSTKSPSRHSRNHHDRLGGRLGDYHTCIPLYHRLSARAADTLHLQISAPDPSFPDNKRSLYSFVLRTDHSPLPFTFANGLPSLVPCDP